MVLTAAHFKIDDVIVWRVGVGLGECVGKGFGKCVVVVCKRCECFLGITCYRQRRVRSLLVLGELLGVAAIPAFK